MSPLRDPDPLRAPDRNRPANDVLVPVVPALEHGAVIAIDVRCAGDPSRGWTCFVTLIDGGRAVSDHEVRVPHSDLERLAPGELDPTDLVRRSFAFLLEREPASSILRRFDLSVIGRFFPDYVATIRQSQ